MSGDRGVPPNSAAAADGASPDLSTAVSLARRMWHALWNLLWNDVPCVSDMPLEALRLEPMASGNEALLLSNRVPWEAFPSYAPALADLLGGKIVDKADSAAERVWTAIIEGRCFFISFDDYPLGVTLEPQDDSAAMLIPTIREKLIHLRSKQRAG
jgi:hypothetical protein